MTRLRDFAANRPVLWAEAANTQPGARVETTKALACRAAGGLPLEHFWPLCCWAGAESLSSVVLTVVLRPEPASESPGAFDKTQISGSHSRFLDSRAQEFAFLMQSQVMLTLMLVLGPPEEPP